MKCVYYRDPGTVKVPVIRHGTDLSTFTSVWCATRPSDPASATPGVDYVPSSRKVEFGPGVTEQVSPQQPKCLKVINPLVASVVSVSFFFFFQIENRFFSHTIYPGLSFPPSTPPRSSQHPSPPDSIPTPSPIKKEVACERQELKVTKQDTRRQDKRPHSQAHTATQQQAKS